MSKSKFYAVKAGRQPGIYSNWSECQAQIKGFAGALFKSFPTREEAEAWVSTAENNNDIDLDLKIYVDGSFLEAGGPAGWGWVAVKEDKEVTFGNGITPEPALSRNIDGELVAALEAAKYLSSKNTMGLICHDYAGIAHWAKGEWQAKSEIAKWYQKEISPYLKWVQFKKVAAHSGDKWNDRADELAKEALKKNQKKKSLNFEWSILGKAPEATINFLIGYAIKYPEVISLAAGLVDPETFPVEPLKESSQKVFNSPSIKLDLQYNSTQGDLGFRTEISKYLDRAFDEKIGSENIIVGNGSQQILYLFNQVSLSAGDIVLIEDPSYYVYMDALKQEQVEMVHLPCDDFGIIPSELERVFVELKKSGEINKVKALYTIPYCQNPTGRSYSKERKVELLKILELWLKESPIFLIEDAAYRDLSFVDSIPSFYQLGFPLDNYLYCGTFSKALAPGLRLGYGLLSKDLLDKMVNIKGSQDFGSSSLTQAIVREFLKDHLDLNHYPSLIQSYKSKAKITEQYLKSYLPETVEYKFPKGGLYFWVSLPDHIDTGMDGAFFKACIDQGLLYVPGELFYQEKVSKSSIRLTYAFQSLEKIDNGIRILGQVVSSFLAD